MSNIRSVYCSIGADDPLTRLCDVSFATSEREPSPRMAPKPVANLDAAYCGVTQSHHVLYVIDQICEMGGAETALLRIVRALTSSPFSCSIVTFNAEPGLEALKDLPCPLHVFPLHRTYDLNALEVALRLRKLIHDKNARIVHTFFETSDLWAGPIAKLSGCPILVSSRRDMGILRNRKHELTYPIVNRFFNRVLAVSDEVRSFCLSHDNLPPERVETLYNGVDLDEVAAKAECYDARSRLGIDVGTPLISTVANIRPVKGIDVLLRAAGVVCREFPEATFLIIGSTLVPDTYADLESLVESIGIRANVRFLGQISNLFPILRESNVFCLPSRSEGFSNALIEAMACGLPCVATRVGGNPEALTEGAEGFLVESEDYELLADRILRLLRDPQKAMQMGKQAHNTVEVRFSMRAMMTRLVQIYTDLLAEHA